VERIWTTELPSHAGERVQLAGWLHRLRRLSKLSFLVLRDARGTLLRIRMLALPYWQSCSVFSR